MKQMVEKPKLLKEYCDFFNTLVNTAKEKAKDKKNIGLFVGGSPTIVNPGEYTKEDGIIFAQWIKLINDTDADLELIQPFFAIKEIRAATDSFDFSTVPWSLNCGAGKGSVSMTCDGKVLSCHRFFRQSINEDNENIAINSYSTSEKEKRNKDYDRLNYLNSLMHNYPESLRYNFDIMAMTMAKYDQIEKEYLYDRNLRMTLFLFTHSCFCPLGQAEETTNILFYTPSYLRLWGNGAVKELIRYALKKGII